MSCIKQINNEIINEEKPTSYVHWNDHIVDDIIRANPIDPKAIQCMSGGTIITQIHYTKYIYYMINYFPFWQCTNINVKIICEDKLE